MKQSSPAPDLTHLRNDFPMLKKSMHGHPLVYLDTAATAQKPQSVIDTMTTFYTEHYGTVHRAIYELSMYSTQEYQNVRNRVATFLNAAKCEEIIFTRGTTESINMVAYSFGKAFVRPGDEILITEMEHHSNIIPWQILCEDRGALLKVAPINERGELILEEFERLLSHRTKLVAVAHVSNSLGTINPIKQLAEMAHAKGAKILVDGAQSTPHLAIDVQDLDVDFYAFSGHKIYGPTGIGILYGKEDLLNAMPPYQGGGDMIDKVTFEKTTYNVLPLKFEAGTPMIAEVMGLGKAIDYLNSVGMENIRQWEHILLERTLHAMEHIPGVHLIGTPKEKGGIVGFTIEGIHPLDIGTMLDLKGVAIRTGHQCAQPVMRHFNVSATARASFGLYNTLEDVDRFIQALDDVVRMLR